MQGAPPVEAIAGSDTLVTVRSATVLARRRRIHFVLLTAGLFASIAFFATYWLRLPEIGRHPVLHARRRALLADRFGPP